MWCIAGDVWKYVCDYSAYLGGSARATQRQKNVFEFIQETIPSGPVSKPHHTPPGPNDHNNVRTTRPDKNENSDTDEVTWSQINNSAQNEATNENDSQTGAPAKKTAQKGATSSDKNDNSDTEEATWNQTDNSAQNEATNENDSQTGAPAKKTAQKGATSSDKNDNSDTEEATWNQTDNSAQNEATNENDSQTGAPAKKTAQKGATDQDEAKSTTAQKTAQSLDNVWSKSYIRVEITSPIGLSVLCLLSQMLANAEAHLLVQCK